MKVGLFVLFFSGCSASNPTHWWTPVWHLDGDAVAPNHPGLLLTQAGLDAQPEWSGSCGSLRRGAVEEAPVLLVPAERPMSFPKAPAVQAAVVERAAWRLGEVMGAPEGIEVGGRRVTSPAEHRGIRVRSVRKTRRNGPPWMVVVGQRDEQIAVALTDKEASETVASMVIDVPQVKNLRLRTVPVADFNQDGTQELVVFADGVDGSGMRAVFSVDMGPKGAVGLDGVQTRGPLDCAR